MLFRKDELDLQYVTLRQINNKEYTIHLQRVFESLEWVTISPSIGLYLVRPRDLSWTSHDMFIWDLWNNFNLNLKF